jgi:hypothetical protein
MYISGSSNGVIPIVIRSSNGVVPIVAVAAVEAVVEVALECYQ